MVSDTASARRPPLARLLALAMPVALALSVLPQTVPSARALPSGFTETTVFGGLTNPVKVAFAADGRVFVAEKSGLIKVFDGLTDTSPTTFANLQTNVYDNWDRGLLGFTLAPNFPVSPYVYVLYTYDHILGDANPAPRWGDACATQTDDGCLSSGRLSRLQASGNQMIGSEQVLIEDWCSQFPSHTVGDLRFGADGMLYVSAGDAASFTFNDYGQDGSPINPCGDPPGGTTTPPGPMTPPTAEGGSLRAQDIRTSGAGDPQSLDGTILRLDPATGLAAPGNPLSGNSDPNVQRIIATGFRNPFRTTIRPGTSEVWVGDVGLSAWEEINRIDWASGMKNAGWPCYEGVPRMAAWDALNLNICENLYTSNPPAVSAPYFAYRHNQPVAGESCWATNGSSTSGLAFYSAGPYPDTYDGALFFADYSRDCIWVMFKGGNGLPDPTNVVPFHTPATNPVDLETGPNGDLFYVDFGGQGTANGSIRRITFQGTGNQAPTAVASANPTSGQVPLTVQFSGTGSSDPNGDPLTYAWDLDGDGAYDDSTSATPSFIYSSAGPVTVGLRVTDPGGLSGTTTVTVTATSGSGSLSYLSDLTPTTAVNGWGPYERDTSNGENVAGDGNPLRLGATTYPKGLGVHAISDLRYPVATSCTSFMADIGIDEEVALDRGSVIFQVYTNGTVRYTSPVMTGASATQSVFVNITGSTELRLAVQTNGSDEADHADWANARVTCGGTGNQAPTAVASANPTSGQVPLTVQFSGTGSSDPNGDPLTYAWDLDGDGAYDDSTSATPSFIYSSAGPVTVGLRVTDPGGLSGTTTVTVTATSGSGSLSYLSDLTPTTAVNGWGPYERDTSNGENVAGDGNPLRLGATTYPKGLGVHAISDLRYPVATSCTSFMADIGIDEEVALDRGSVIFQVYTNGTVRYTSPVMTGASATQSVFVNITGSTELRLAVQTNGSDEADHADWANARVTCGGTGNQAPTAVASANPTSGQVPLTVQFSGTGSSDPNGDPLTYAWDLDGDGAYDDSTSATPSFIYSSAGPVTIGLRVTDPGGLSGTTTVTVTVSGPANQAPTAVASANPTSGQVPLTVQFSGTGSSDPNGDPLTYAWDLDGDGAYDDSTSATPSFIYSSAGPVTVGLRVTDPGGLSDTDSLTVTVSAAPPNELPVPIIDTPSSSFTWAVGDPIPFSGGASDDEDGEVAVGGLAWALIVHHCTPGGGCHEHPPVAQVSGVDEETFIAPDHEYPSHLELRLTATDSDGGSASTSVLLQPKTVNLTFTTGPATGLQLVVANVVGTTPFTRTFIVNSRFTATAVTPQTVGAATYTFQGWSDGGAASHEISAPTTATTYTATYAPQATLTLSPVADAYVRASQATRNFGTANRLNVASNAYRSYIRFTVSGLTGTVNNVKLRLRVTDPSTNGGRIYAVGGGWTETGITWNNAPVISGTPVATIGATTDNTWKELDLTSVVTGNGTYNLAISDGNSNNAQYTSREASSNRPQLVITTTP